MLDISTDYGDQYLMIVARLANGPSQKELPIEQDLAQLKRYIASFPSRFQDKQTAWVSQLSDLRNENHKVVLWGSGSKATSFLTTLEAEDTVQYVVDINPVRQSSYVAGTGHEIVAPASLRNFEPDVVIIMNRIYRGEISTDLKNMGLNPRVITL